METDTAGNIIYGFINCDCNLTGGCAKCRPSFIGCINDEEADKMRKELQDWRKRFDEDIKRRAKELKTKFMSSNENIREKKLKRVIYEYEDGTVKEITEQNLKNYTDNLAMVSSIVATRSYLKFKPVEWKEIKKEKINS